VARPAPEGLQAIDCTPLSVSGQVSPE